VKLRALTTGLVLAAGLTFGGIGTANAAPVTPTAALVDLFTVTFWSQPAAQEAQTCALLKKSPTKAAKVFIKEVGNVASLRNQLGLNATPTTSGRSRGPDAGLRDNPPTMLSLPMPFQES